MNFSIEEALHKHADWKLKLRTAISTKEKLDAATITKDNCCDVGRWLYGEGKKRWSSSPELQNAIDAHKAFHQQAGRIAALVNAGKYSEAEAALGANSAYARASNELGTALIRLKKVLAL
jgi:methyl-accepting chemotaxis protein